MLHFFKMTFVKQKKISSAASDFFMLYWEHRTYKVVFLLFDGHLTAIFATKLPQFLVLPIYQQQQNNTTVIDGYIVSS